MTDLHLTADDDHVERLARENDPVRAIVELIWNAVDAEATRVNVSLCRDDQLGSISKTIVQDNGHGISQDELESTFGRIGGSWKRLATKTKNGKRGLHGKQGQGRLRAFALGSRVTWRSVAVDTAGVARCLDISCSTKRRHIFTWDSQPIDDATTGTTVTVFNDSQKSLSALEAPRTRTTLLSHFAPVLMNDDDLRITYGGNDLNPQEDVENTKDYPLHFRDKDGREYDAELRIVEWKTSKHYAIYYGQDKEHFVHEESAIDVERHFSYSAYVTWDGLDRDALSLLGLGHMSDTPSGALWTAARNGIRQHFQDRRRERRGEQLEKWKKDAVYPFEGAAKSETEKVERAVFDVVAGTIAAQIPTKRESAKVTLGVLKTALRQEPEQIAVIINEVASLTQDDRKSLTRLLNETTLSGVIKAASMVTGRNKFLAGIERLIFPPDGTATIGERDHLHPMLERELWIFGEQYHLMSSERGLTELARNHLNLLGLPSRKVDPVRRWDEKSGRIDLHLATKIQEFEVARHLIVELKAPGIVLGRKEINQVEDYAQVILSKAVFASDKAAWDIILVGTDFDDIVNNRFLPGFRSQGLVLAPERKPGHPKVQVFVRRWRDILDENRTRLKLFTANLDHDPSLEDGLRHIQENYADLLPTCLQSEDTA